jgi:hypothetical protein
MIWQRQSQVNQLRSALREYYPGALEAFGTELAHSDALAVLALAPTPEQGKGLSHARIASALRRAGRQRNVERRAGEILAALRAERLTAPGTLSSAFGADTRAAVAVLSTMNIQLVALEAELSSGARSRYQRSRVGSATAQGHASRRRTGSEHRLSSEAATALRGQDPERRHHILPPHAPYYVSADQLASDSLRDSVRCWSSSSRQSSTPCR